MRWMAEQGQRAGQEAAEQMDRAQQVREAQRIAIAEELDGNPGAGRQAQLQGMLRRLDRLDNFESRVGDKPPVQDTPMNAREMIASLAANKALEK